MNERQNELYKYVMGISQILIVAGGGFLYTSFHDTQQTLVAKVQELAVTTAVQAQAISGLTGSIEAIAVDRYTATQAKSDNALFEQRLKRMEQWGQNLSERVRLLEQNDHEHDRSDM